MAYLDNSLRKLQQQSRPKCHGFVCLYSCIEEYKDTVGSSNEIQSFTLPYQYEIHSSVTTIDLSSEMKLLESIMLDYLSDLTNIETCDIFPDGNHLTFDDNSNGHNWLFPQVDLSNETIIGLASSPLDSVDNDRSNCFADDQVALSGTTCIPIKGEMNIIYKSSVEKEVSENKIKESMLNLIEKGMTEDSFVTNNILKLTYIAEGQNRLGGGGEMLPVGFDDGSYNQTIEPSASSSNIGISVSIVTMTTMMVIGTAFFVKRKLNKRKGIQSDSLSPDASPSEAAHESKKTKGSFSVGMGDCEYDNGDNDAEGVANPAKEKYDSQDNILFNNRRFLSTISEVSEETDSSALFLRDGSVCAPDFTRMLSESTYEDEEMV